MCFHVAVFKICIDKFLGLGVIELNFPWFASKFTPKLEVIFSWLDKQLMCISAEKDMLGHISADVANVYVM